MVLHLELFWLVDMWKRFVDDNNAYIEKAPRTMSNILVDGTYYLLYVGYLHEIHR